MNTLCLVVLLIHTIACVVLAQNYNGPFTIQNFPLPDGNLLFHDIFISEDSKIIFVAAPGFGLFQNISIFNTVTASAWCHDEKYVVSSQSPTLTRHANMPLTLKTILDEQFDGEVKIIGEFTHPELAKAIASNRHVNLEIEFGSISKSFFLRTEYPLWYRAPYDIAVFAMIKTDLANQIKAFIEHYRSVGADHIIIYINGVISDFPHTHELVYAMWETGEPVTFVEWDYPFWKRSDTLGYDVHYSQVLGLHSSFYRMKGLTRWFGHFDLDEYLVFDNTAANSDIPKNGPFFTLNALMNSYPYDSTGVVRFRSAPAYLTSTGFHLNDFKIWRIYSSNFVRETNITAHRSKYLANSKLTKRLNVHNAGGGGTFVESGYFFLNFGFDHPPGKMMRDITAFSDETVFASLMNAPALAQAERIAAISALVQKRMEATTNSSTTIKARKPGGFTVDDLKMVASSHVPPNTAVDTVLSAAKSTTRNDDDEEALALEKIEFIDMGPAKALMDSLPIDPDFASVASDETMNSGRRKLRHSGRLRNRMA